MATEQAGAVTTLDFKELMNFIAKESTELKRVVQEKHDQLKTAVQDKHDQLDKNMQTMAKSLSQIIVKVDSKIERLSSEVEAKAKETDMKLVEMEGNMRKIDHEVIMLQLKSMEHAIRLRGLRENSKEDLRKTCAEALAKLLKVDPGEIYAKIDKTYRVNSRIALQRQLPRDVVIYFTERNFRNDIVQKSYYSSTHVEGHLISVFKELPPAVLKLRRDFGFLVAELKKREIPFRWDAPMGVIFRYEGVRYRLNTIDKARDFYDGILKASATPPRTRTCTSTPTPADLDIIEQRLFEKETEEQIRQIQEQRGAQGAASGSQVDLSRSLLCSSVEESSKIFSEMPVLEPVEQRVTRATTRQMQESQKQGQLQQQGTKKNKGKGKKETEAVGGAEPKTSLVERDLQQMLSMFQTGLKDA